MLGGELVWAAYECVATVSLKVAAWAIGGGVLIGFGWKLYYI